MRVSERSGVASQCTIMGEERGSQKSSSNGSDSASSWQRQLMQSLVWTTERAAKVPTKLEVILEFPNFLHPLPSSSLCFTDEQLSALNELVPRLHAMSVAIDAKSSLAHLVAWLQLVVLAAAERFQAEWTPSFCSISHAL